MTYSRFVLRPRFRIACISKTALKFMATKLATMLVADATFPRVSSAQIPPTPDEAKVLSLSFGFGSDPHKPILAACRTTVEDSPEAVGWIRKHQGIGGLYIVSGPIERDNPPTNETFNLTLPAPETVGWEVDMPYSFRLEVKNSDESPDHFEGIVHFIIVEVEGSLTIQYVQQGGGEG